jgi:hypothetical protein
MFNRNTRSESMSAMMVAQVSHGKPMAASGG